jgi:hypothetical protein
LAIYNTASDSANTAVRSFLTKLGEQYLGRSINTGSGKGKKDWARIKETVFGNACAYCGVSDVALGMEHLIMFNRAECGLHHPGNLVPCCTPCNKRARDENKAYVDWRTHLESRDISRSDKDKRLRRIEAHIVAEDYPELSGDEQKAIEILANSLYSSIQAEVQKSLDIYSELDEALIHSR